MLIMRLARTIALASAFAVVPEAGGAQELRAAASGRGVTRITLNPSREDAQRGVQAATISIDFGQPHSRGRQVAGALPGDIGQVWRLGANEATTLHAEVDLTIGTLTVPKGSYTLAAVTSAGDWQLIVNRKTGQWGIPYDSSTELGRTALTSQSLATPLESFTMWLVPAADGSASGTIRFAWGTRSFSVPWRAR
jgi:hypothetical protein